MFHSRSQNILTIRILVLLPLLMGMFSSCNRSSSPAKELAINVAEQPTIGEADTPVHVVVFEEPKCPGCKKFSSLIFPLLKKDYIDTHKVRYSMIPVSFVPGSMLAAEAWLCVYHQDKEGPRLAFDYINYTYANQPAEESDWATEATMLKFAESANAEINLEKLKECLTQHHFRSQIEKNTDEGIKLMDGEIATPGVFVNGIQLLDVNYHQLNQRIQEELQKSNKK